jgi:ankyrin repeat protein
MLGSTVPSETGMMSGSSCKRRQHAYTPLVHIDSPLIQLCRTKQWAKVLQRCYAHPEEVAPQLLAHDSASNRFNMHSPKRVSNENFFSHDDNNHPQCPIYHDTALGIACASQDIGSEEMLVVITALLNASPEQLNTSQLIPGHIPLRDALRNPHCSTRVLRILLNPKYNEDSKESVVKAALDQKDRDGLYPIDHVIMGVQLGAPEHSLNLLKEFVRVPTRITHENHDVSPLIRLLTLGTAFGLKRTEIDCSPWQKPVTDNVSRLSRILDCAKHLLDKDPELLHKTSNATGCSPLHVALRNYGRFEPLIRELLARDGDKTIIKLRNIYGDLPLHVACAVGVPIHVLRLILDSTIQAPCSWSNQDASPHPLVWSTNVSGYTPIDLEWVRHIESGKGFYSTRSFYPLEASGIRKHCRKQDEYYQSLLREAVDQVMHKCPIRDSNKDGSRDDEAQCTFGILLDRLTLLIQCASSRRLPCQTSTNLLHSACSLSLPHGPSLPLPVLELILWLHPEQLLKPDEKQNLPLHYVLSPSKGLSKVAGTASCDSWKDFVENLLSAAPKSVQIADGNGRLPLHVVLDSRHNNTLTTTQEIQSSHHSIIQQLVELCPESIDIRDPESQLYPFMMAAACPSPSLDSVFFLLHRSPSRCR